MQRCTRERDYRMCTRDYRTCTIDYRMYTRDYRMCTSCGMPLFQAYQAVEFLFDIACLTKINYVIDRDVTEHYILIVR